MYKSFVGLGIASWILLAGSSYSEWIGGTRGWNYSNADTNFYPWSTACKVGIGTASPEGKLHIDSGTGIGIAEKVLIKSRSSGYGQFQIGRPDVDEVSIAFLAGATAFGNPPTLAAGGYAWVIGPNIWSIGADKFGIGRYKQEDGTKTYKWYLTEAGGMHVSGNVGIGTTSPGVKLDVDGVANSNYEGFSYYTTGYAKSAGWNPVICDILDFNTFGTSAYNISTGTFTAPKAGYYRFRSHGYMPTSGTANERIGIGIYKNGTLRGFSGGQFSASDTPGPQFSHVVYLQAGDTVRLYSYTPINCAFGSTQGGHYWWFQGEYVGK